MNDTDGPHSPSAEMVLCESLECILVYAYILCVCVCVNATQRWDLYKVCHPLCLFYMCSAIMWALHIHMALKCLNNVSWATKQKIKPLTRVTRGHFFMWKFLKIFPSTLNCFIQSRLVHQHTEQLAYQQTAFHSLHLFSFILHFHFSFLQIR